MGCGGRGWFKGGRSWDNPDHCYDGCASCISEAVNRGANDVQCDQNVGFASCWMGYHWAMVQRKWDTFFHNFSYESASTLPVIVTKFRKICYPTKIKLYMRACVAARVSIQVRMLLASDYNDLSRRKGRKKAAATATGQTTPHPHATRGCLECLSSWMTSHIGNLLTPPVGHSDCVLFFWRTWHWLFDLTHSIYYIFLWLVSGLTIEIAMPFFVFRLPSSPCPARTINVSSLANIFCSHWQVVWFLSHSGWTRKHIVRHIFERCYVIFCYCKYDLRSVSLASHGHRTCSHLLRLNP